MYVCMYMCMCICGERKEGDTVVSFVFLLFFLQNNLIVYYMALLVFFGVFAAVDADDDLFALWCSCMWL